MSGNMFEVASRNKFRYTTKQGLITTEDLWDLPLTHRSGASLDDLAKSLNRELKQNEEESFVSVRTKSNTELELKFEIVKHVIAVKLQEKSEAETKLAKKAEKERLQEILASKKDEALKGKTVEEIEEMLKGLEG